MAILSGWFEQDIIEPAPEPIVFELQPPPSSQKPTQVVETPNDAQTIPKPENADYLSDKNALARNQQENDALPVDKAFAVGDLNAAELPTPFGQPGENEMDPSKKNPAPEKIKKPAPNGTKTDASDFRREALIKNASERKAGVKKSSNRPKHDNQDSRALDNGGLSFNTYNWEFAPYIIWLKKHVEQNIFPPAAFVRMGIIDGETVLRFRIYPDGKLENLEIINYEGHHTLMETSKRAIEVSAPFKKLPGDFPEPYLEITAIFKYSNLKNLRQKGK